MTIDDVIKSFCEVVKRGPEYVCTICHCLMYKQSVYPFQSDKFVDKFDNDDFEMLIGCEHVTLDGNGSTSKGKVPRQAITDGLELGKVPEELKCLNKLELELISLRIPFLKMVALPSGKQSCVHGPAVNVPSKLDNVCTLLPRLPGQTDLVLLTLDKN